MYRYRSSYTNFDSNIEGCITVILFCAIIGFLFLLIIFSDKQSHSEQVKYWQEFLTKHECTLVEKGKYEYRVGTQDVYLCNDGIRYWINENIIDDIEKK